MNRTCSLLVCTGQQTNQLYHTGQGLPNLLYLPRGLSLHPLSIIIHFFYTLIFNLIHFQAIRIKKQQMIYIPVTSKNVFIFIYFTSFSEGSIPMSLPDANLSLCSWSMSLFLLCVKGESFVPVFSLPLPLSHFLSYSHSIFLSILLPTTNFYLSTYRVYK